MKKASKYFPELYIRNRKFAKKLLQEFKEANFENDNEVYHDMREFIRYPIEEWHKGAFLPDEMLDERDEIRSRLDKYEFYLPENPSDEDYAQYNAALRVKMETPEWKEWMAWLKKSKSVLQRYPRLEQETHLAKEIILFHQNGKNIFEFSPYLLKLLENTDVGNIRFKDFLLPYKSLYFHFGNLEGLEYPLECYEEKFGEYLAHGLNFETDEEEDEFYSNKNFNLVGAFVTSRERSIDVCLCFKDHRANDDDKTIGLQNDNRYPSFDFTLDFGKWDSDLSGFIKDNETPFNQSTVVFSDIWDEDSVVSEIDYGKLSQLTKSPDKCQNYEWKEYVLIDKALKLIVNGICYLNSNEKEIKISATNEQAAELLHQLSTSKKSREKYKLEEKLKRHTYSRIHYLGSSLKKYYENENSESEVEPHWRRGHWRNQPFGKNLSESKLIWIKPTIVRKDKGDPVTGHIYHAE